MSPPPHDNHRSPAPRFDNYAIDPETLARRLLGQRLVRVIDGARCAGIIVETEAYLGAVDQAAHTHKGRRTARNQSMFLAGGHAYVYFTYGMHYCMNVVAGETDDGVAVLIRALEPTEGVADMWDRRPAARRERDLCSGPARLTQALRIDRELDGEDLRTSGRLFVERVRRRAFPAARVALGPRVGVAYAGEWAARPLRYCLRDSFHVSRPRPPS